MIKKTTENSAKVENNREKREWLAPKLIDEVVERTENGNASLHIEGRGPGYTFYHS